MKSDRFRDGVRRARNLVNFGCQQGLRGIKRVAHWYHGITTSEIVETGVATSSDLLDLYLAKSSRRITVLVAIFFVSSILILSWPQSEQTDTASMLEKTAPGIKRSVPGMPDFSITPAGQERKAAFFGYFLPIIENENRSILATRKIINIWHQKHSKINRNDATQIVDVATRYRIDDFDIKSEKSWNQLFNRVDVVPPSLALAQSANESAWGTSRFAREGLNFFGQWCYSKGCGLVPKKRDANKTHEVAVFKSPQESVRRYI